MNNSWVSSFVRGLMRGGLLLALVFGLGFTGSAQAQDEFGFSTITLYAPGAPEGAVATVQWQDQAGAWRNVAGWQAPLEIADDASTTFQQWAVYPQDYGRGPFRWTVTSQPGNVVWATSTPFFLPDGDGAALAVSVSPSRAGGPTTTGMPAANFSTISIQAPGAPEGAWVGVQWRDEMGRWHNVEGWQGPLEMTTISTAATDSTDAAATATAATPEVATKQWGVFERDYGRGPFRWIVYAPTGGAVFATSPRFFLPSGGGTNLSMTVLPKIAVVPADALTAEMTGEPTALNAQTSTWGLNCGTGPCNSVISLSVPEATAGSLVGVQWQDPFGLWHDVPTWRGSLDASGSNDTAYQQWTIGTDLQGRGPFRWVIYNPLGDTVLGVTPGFMLPDRGGVNLNTSIPADVSDIAG
jgi:hypothetical protein